MTSPSASDSKAVFPRTPITAGIFQVRARIATWLVAPAFLKRDTRDPGVACRLMASDGLDIAGGEDRSLGGTKRLSTAECISRVRSQRALRLSRPKADAPSFRRFRITRTKASSMSTARSARYEIARRARSIPRRARRHLSLRTASILVRVSLSKRFPDLRNELRDRRSIISCASMISDCSRLRSHL